MQLIMNLTATGNWSTHIFDVFTLSVLLWAPLIVNTVNTINLRANLYIGQITYTYINLSFQVPFSTSATTLSWLPVDMSHGSSLLNFTDAGFQLMPVCLALFNSRAAPVSALVPLHMYENHAFFYNTLTHMNLWPTIFPWYFLVELFLNQ